MFACRCCCLHKVFCVELPSDNSRSGKKTKDKVTGKKGKHSIHVNKSLDERKKKYTSWLLHGHVYWESCVCAVFANWISIPGDYSVINNFVPSGGLPGSCMQITYCVYKAITRICLFGIWNFITLEFESFVYLWKWLPLLTCSMACVILVSTLYLLILFISLKNWYETT